MPDIFDQVSTNAAPAGDVFDQVAGHPGYWQELYQQSGIPGLIKGIKEHPAETVASAIGGLFAPLNPNYTQSPQGQAMKENLTRSPQSLEAALTLGGLAAVPAVGKIVPPVGEALDTAAAATGGAIKGGIQAGLEPVRYGHFRLPIPSAAAGAAAGHYVGSMAGAPELGAVTGAAYPIIRGAIKGAKAAIAEPGEGEAAAGVTATAAATKTPGQLLAESDGKTWSKIGKAEKQVYEQIATERTKFEGNVAAEGPNIPKPPRTPESYGVTASQPAVPRDVSQTVPQPAPAANVTPIRPEPAATPPEPAPETAPARLTPAAAAKSARYADAISKWAKDMGMSPKAIAEQWEGTTPETRGRILLQLKQKGYLEARETIPDTSAPSIVDALKAKAATIRPPAGFSMGAMKQ